MTIISRFLHSKDHTEVAVLNSGLGFSMEFGKNWLQPIQDRLKRKYNHLTIEELNNYDSVCQQARDKTCHYIYERLVDLCKNQGTIKMNDLREAFDTFLSGQYPWISKKNRHALFLQSLYYAGKDGWDTCIKG